MCRAVTALVIVAASLLFAPVVSAQEPPPRIGPYVVDVRAAFPAFSDDAQLAASRGLNQAELPGVGLGVGGGAHVYLPKFGPVTIGVGAEGLIARSRFVPPDTPGQTLRAVTERFKTAQPQVSINFGSGNGWSYLSFGIGRSKWSIVPDGGEPLPVDDTSIRTIGYGGGARWFAKKHLAFSLDVRLYEIDGTPPYGVLPGSPRTVLLVISGGIATR